MFTKPFSQITYMDVEQFCASFVEGVRVEYKSEMIDGIPKVISGFANTLGGVVIIGVEADKVNNKVISIKGIDKQDGLEEKIISSSLNGIYPSVVPEIKIVEIPDKPGKIIIVIRVHESVEAPHAIQNSTRVYIRTGSVNQPYELAEVDRIEYLLKRRQEPDRRRLDLIDHASNRLKQQLEPTVFNKPYLQISVAPLFPYKPLASLGALQEFCNGMGLGSPVGFSLQNAQRVTDGVCKFSGKPDDFDYVEVNHYGLVYFSELLSKSRSSWVSSSQEKNEKSYLRFVQFVERAARTLMLAASYYSRFSYYGNVQIRFELHNIANETLIFNEQGIFFNDDYKSVDVRTSSELIVALGDIQQNLAAVVSQLMQKVVWVFNCPVEDPRPQVDKIFVANRLMTNVQ